MRRTAAAAALSTLLLVLAACNVPGLSSSPASGGTLATSGGQAASGAQVVTGGTVRVSGSPSPGSAPGVAVSPTPAWDKVILPTMKAPTPSPANIACVGAHGPGYTVPITLTHTASSATATWWHNGDAAVVSYRIAAVPTPLIGTTPSLAWVTVPPGSGCHELTANLSLTPGVGYEIWLDVVSASPAYAGRTIDLMVGRTPGFVAS
jgi:hypothetical protein